MNLWLLLVVSGLAAARTHRLFTLDEFGAPVRNKFYDFAFWVMPPEAKGLISYVKRKNVSWWAWKRYRAAQTLEAGFECPFCFAYWYGLIWLGTGLAWGDSTLWQLAAGGFAMSYVVGHVSSRIDVPAEDA